MLTREAKGRCCLEPVSHTVPMCYEVACLFAAHHAARGQTRLGAAIIVQMGAGLRPSELLSLRREHVFLPLDHNQAISVRLGVEHSTKIKREQFVQIFKHEFPWAFELMNRLCAASKDGERIFPFSYTTYNNSFSQAEEHFGLLLHLTAHSGRAGFATSRIMEGADPTVVQKAGRWKSETSFRTYIDVAGSLHTRTQVEASKHMQAAKWCQQHLLEYFVNLSPAHEPATESSSFSGAQTRRDEAGPATQREQVAPSSTTGRAHGLSAQGLAQRSAAETRIALLQRRSRSQAIPKISVGSSANTYQSGSKGNGKGRGRLLPQGRAAQSIFD